MGSVNVKWVSEERIVVNHIVSMVVVDMANVIVIDVNVILITME